MSNCNTSLNGIDKICENNYGGVTNVYILPKEDLTFKSFDADGVLTGFTASGVFEEYEFAQGHAVANSESAIDFEAGTNVYNNTITINFKYQDADKRAELLLLTKAQQELIVIYRLDTGLYKVIGLSGEKTGARVSSITAESGQNRADGNQYILEISVTEDKELPHFVDDTLAAALTV
jgi:hypothetical protein